MTICELCKKECENPQEVTVRCKKFYICDECYEGFDADNYGYCEMCNELISNDDIYYIDSCDMDLCDSCYESEIITCDGCGCDYLRDNVEEDANGDHYCEDCLSNDYAICENCGMAYRRDEMYDSGLGWYCDDCYNPVIYPYHEADVTLEYFGNSKEEKEPYLGIELEVDRGGKDEGVAQYIADTLPGNFVYFEEDSSIENGFEIITQPATYYYHYYLTNKYKEVMSYLKRNDYISHDASSCGLHIHVDREWFGDEENEEKSITVLLYIFKKFHNELLKFSRRNKETLNRYCAMYDGVEIEETVKNIKNKNWYSFDRYKAINLTNYSTIEFRLFRGTLKLNTFIASLQLVRNMCTMAKEMKNPDDVDNLEWKDFLVQDEIKTYWEEVKNRRI